MGDSYIYLIPMSIAIFLAFNMGASGTAPSFAAAYGANLVRRELIPGIFGVFVILGGLLAGGKVVKTIGGEIVPSGEMGLVLVSIILLASALSIFFANVLKVPQSTSQSTVLSLTGCALYLGNLQTRKLFFEIIPTWFVLPILCFVFTLGLGLILRKMAETRYVPDFQHLQDRMHWKYITIACSAYVAFSIGSNNIANAAGPIASMMNNELDMGSGAVDFIIPLIAVLLVAPWFGIGSSIMGGRVLQTTGRDIVSIGPMGATLIAVITATLLLLASTLRGIPASLVQMNTFAIIALSMLRKKPRDAQSKRTMIKLMMTWMVAPVIAFVVAWSLMAAADQIGIL